MPAAYSERPEVGMHLRWTPVIGGALCALASYIVLGLFSSALGWDAVRLTNTHGAARFFAILIGVFIAPIASGLLGGFIASRLAGVTQERNAMIYGLLAWCLAFVVGIAFVGGPFSFWSPNVAARVSSDSVSVFARFAAWAAWSGLAALIGVCCSLAGASMGRHSMLGHRMLPRVRFERGAAMRTSSSQSGYHRDDMHSDSAFRTGVHSDGSADPLSTPMRRSEIDETDMRH